jgi:hypothetical protein
VLVYFYNGRQRSGRNDGFGLCRSKSFLARKAQHARIEKDMPKNVPIQPTEANYLAGAELYKAALRGLPRIAAGAEDGDCDWDVSAAAAAVSGQGRDRRRAGRKLLEDIQRLSADRHAGLQQVAE